MTGQPDFAHLVIDYVPGDWLVESKSLKLFLLFPQSRRLSRGLHHLDRAASGRFSVSRAGCGSAAIGIRAAAFRSTSSGKAVQCPPMSGSPIRACRPIAGEARAKQRHGGQRHDQQKDGLGQDQREMARAKREKRGQRCRSTPGLQSRSAAAIATGTRPDRQGGGHQPQTVQRETGQKAQHRIPAGAAIRPLPLPRPDSNSTASSTTGSMTTRCSFDHRGDIARPYR